MCVQFFVLFFKLAAEAENSDNAQEQKRQMGKRVRYGEIIQVRTMPTHKDLFILNVCNALNVKHT